MAKMQWKSKEQIEQEQRQAEEQAVIAKYQQERLENVTNDVDVLAETVMFTMSDSAVIADTLTYILMELEEIKSGIQ